MCLGIQRKGTSENKIGELRFVYTMGYYAAKRKKGLLPFAASWMELESTMLSE